MAPAQSELSAPPRAPRYLTLDHWRGIACLLVVLFHSSGVAFLSMEASGTQPQQAGLAGLALSITRIGWIGVPFFFVISGYAISATADSSRRGRGGPIGYFKRRIRRIYPPLWAMLVLQVAIVVRGRRLPVPWPARRTASRRSSEPWRFDLPQWIGNVTLTESWRYHLPFSDSPRDYIIGQAWTLCLRGAVLPRRWRCADLRGAAVLLGRGRGHHRRHPASGGRAARRSPLQRVLLRRLLDRVRDGDPDLLADQLRDADDGVRHVGPARGRADLRGHDRPTARASWNATSPQRPSSA